MSDPQSDQIPNKFQKTTKQHRNRQRYQKTKGEEETTNQITEKPKKTEKQKQSPTKKTQKKPVTKNSQRKPQISREEYLLRDQRKQIVSDINEYLNDQHTDDVIKPLQDEVFDRDDDEEEKIMEDDEDDYDLVDPESVPNKKQKKEILKNMIKNGEIIPTIVDRRMINDALDDEELEDDEQIREQLYQHYVIDNQYVNNFGELPLQQPADSSSSFSYTLLIMFMIIGSVYYVLQEAIRRRQREEEPEKYGSGGDNLLGGSQNGVGDQVQKFFGDAQRMAERVARGMLDQIENRYRVDHNNHGFNSNQNNDVSYANDASYVPDGQPTLGARSFESLASQSEPILRSTRSNSEDPQGKASPSVGVIVKENKKMQEKKKEQEEVHDDNFDQA